VMSVLICKAEWKEPSPPNTASLCKLCRMRGEPAWNGRRRNSSRGGRVSRLAPWKPPSRKCSPTERKLLPLSVTLSARMSDDWNAVVTPASTSFVHPGTFLDSQPCLQASNFPGILTQEHLCPT